MNEPPFAFGKMLGVSEIALSEPKLLIDSIARLIFCMKETNKLHKVNCEFFRLDFRQPYFDERLRFPFGCLMLDMKWGTKKELEEKGESNSDK